MLDEMNRRDACNLNELPAKVMYKEGIRQNYMHVHTCD